MSLSGLLLRSPLPPDLLPLLISNSAPYNFRLHEVSPQYQLLFMIYFSVTSSASANNWQSGQSTSLICLVQIFKSNDLTDPLYPFSY